MDGVNKTLYIPLYGKSFVSQKGLFLNDKKAEEIWAAEGFALKGKSGSKWLAYYMGIRAAVFDEWTKQQMNKFSDAAVLHIGCGMDSRCLRAGTANFRWYDVDFPQVIRERKRYYEETRYYHMISGDARDCKWIDSIPEKRHAIVIMEGVSMYMTCEELSTLITNLSSHFEGLSLLVDCYTTMAAKISKYKNPINDVGVTAVYGVDDPLTLCQAEVSFVKEHDMTPKMYIDELQGMEKHIFRRLYAGKFAKKLYRMYEFKKSNS